MPTGITGPDAQTPIQARELIAVNLRREWDDPAAIAAKVAAYADDPLLLRMLRGAVSKWAPQHAGLVPLPEPVAAEPDARMLWQLNLAGDADLPIQPGRSRIASRRRSSTRSTRCRTEGSAPMPMPISSTGNLLRCRTGPIRG